MQSSHSDFWEFWNFADQAHEIRRSIRIRATTVAPMLAGLLVVSLLVLAISQGPTLIAGGGSAGSSGQYDAASPADTHLHPESHRDVEVAGSTGSVAGAEGVPSDGPGVDPDDARARHAETAPDHAGGSASPPPDEGAGNGGGADEAASSHGEGSHAGVPSGAPAPDDQAEAPADDGADTAPAHASPGTHALGGAAREPIPDVPDVDDVDDGHGEACAAHDGGHAMGSPCPEEAAAEPVPPTVPGGVPATPVPPTVPGGVPATPVPPTVPGGVPATVAMWCVLEPVGTAAIGCGPGTTQVLELVEVATVDPLTIAVWCLPQVTDVGVTECGEGDPHLLEIVSPGVVVPAASPAAESTMVAAEATPEPVAAGQNAALLQSGSSEDAAAETGAGWPAPEGDQASASSPGDGDPPMHDHPHDHSYDHSAEHGGCDRTWEPHHDGGDA